MVFSSVKHRFGAVSFAVLLVALPVAAMAAEEEEKGLSTTEAQQFMGHWMLSAEFQGTPTKLGLTLEERGGFLEATVVGFFGEAEGENLRRDAEKLIFDVNAGVGVFRMEVALQDGKLEGGLFSEEALLAAFTGEESDRTTLARFLIPENETRIERGEQLVRFRFVQAKHEGQDYERVSELEPGSVLQFVEHEAMKLTTELPLKVQGLEVPVGNITADYPGVYSLWLKRTEAGWSLVFNEKPDVWGTQHDAAADIGEVKLQHQAGQPPSELLKAEFVDEEGGQELRISWGEHLWTTALEVQTGSGP